MRLSLTRLGVAISLLLIAGVAQAANFSPAFKACELTTVGSNTSLVLIGGAETRGFITCEKTNGQVVAQQVVLTMAGLSLGVGHCSMDVEISLVGADLGINLTSKTIRELLLIAEIGPVVPGKSSLAAAVTLDLENVGASVAIGNVTYGNGCLQLAALRFGAIYDAGAYDRRQEERRQQQMESGR
jgi:hypothetical protein